MKEKVKKSVFNSMSLTAVRPTVEVLVGLKTTRSTDFDVMPADRVLTMAKLKFGERQQRVIDSDRVFIYHPGGIASWVYENHVSVFRPLTKRAGLVCDFAAPEQPDAPHCFSTMYSGQEKVGAGDNLFDTMSAAGKRAAIIYKAGDSAADFLKKQKADCFVYKSREHCIMKAQELMEQDQHQLILLCDASYDEVLQKKGPESKAALQEIREDVAAFCKIHDMAKTIWKQHNTVLAFAPDHGCHKKLFGRGGMGTNTPEDRNIKQFFSFLCREEVVFEETAENQ